MSTSSARHRGALKFYIKAFRLAIDDLSTAISLDTKCLHAYFNRALCHHQNNNWLLVGKGHTLCYENSIDLNGSPLTIIWCTRKTLLTHTPTLPYPYIPYTYFPIPLLSHSPTIPYPYSPIPLLFHILTLPYPYSSIPLYPPYP